MSIQGNSARAYIDLLPQTLMWRRSADEISLVEEFHLGRVRNQFLAFLEKSGKEFSEEVEELTELWDETSEKQKEIVLMYPNLSNLMGSGAHPKEEIIRQFTAALTLLVPKGHSNRAIGQCWCPSGNRHIDGSGAISQWPILNDRVALDLDSPDEIAIGSETPPAAEGWSPIDEKMRDSTLSSINQAYSCVTNLRPSLGAFLNACTRSIVLRQSTSGMFASYSSCYYIGRNTLVNPQLVDRLLLSEALLHEAIHSYLYMIDPDPFWGLKSASDAADATVISPWTNRSLPLFAFLHACFVWYGLFFFWARVMQREGATNGRAVDHLSYAQGGFMRRKLVDVLGRQNRDLVKQPVLLAIEAMGRNILKVAG